MILRTARLELRPLEAGDVPLLWPVVSRPDFPRFMNWDAHRDPAETAAFVEAMEADRAAGTDLALVLRRRDGGDLVGMMGLHDIARTVRAWRVDRAELGYWIAPDHQGRGHATEAGREVLRYAFEDLALHKVTVGCVEDNAASRRVIEKLGFRLVGLQRHHLHRFDRWWDHRTYELCADEPAARRLAG